MIEILCSGKVHYRRPSDHPDVAEIKALIANGDAPAYSLREIPAKYWRHEVNGRVGAFPTKPSDNWHEITFEQYEAEKRLADALKGCGNLI